MSNDENERQYAAMVEFLGTFTLAVTPPTKLQDLSDGVVLFEALAEMCVSFIYFTMIRVAFVTLSHTHSRTHP